MEINELNAQIRNVSGKGFARRLRMKGLIPAVCYGPGKDTLLLAVNAADLAVLRKKQENAFIKLVIDNQGAKVEKLSMLKELQVEPLTRSFVHADFYEITMDHALTFDIPVHFSGKPKGVIDGGELHLLKRELRVSCLPAMRPEAINVDLSGLSIGGSFKVEDIAPMDNVTIEDQGDDVLATVTAIKAAARTAEETAAAAAGTAETPAK